MSDPFDSLAEIVRSHKLHIVENEKETDKIDSFTFYQELNSHVRTSIEVEKKHLKFIGKMIYGQKGNGLGILWRGEPPELIIMGINGYLKERYNKEPQVYILYDRELEEYNIIKA